MEDELLTMDDFLGEDGDIIDTSDPDYSPGTGDPIPEEDEEPNQDPPKPETKDEEPLEPGDEEDPKPWEDDPEDPRKKSDEEDPKPEDKEDPKEDDPKSEDEDFDIIEKFLERYNIVGGLIDTSEGEKAFKDLTPEQQIKALEQIVDSTRPSVEEEYQLTDEELSLLNAVRTSKLSVNDFMQKSAQEFSAIQSAEALFNSEEYRFEDMDADRVYAAYIKANNPEISESALQDEVSTAKQSALYNTTVEALRKDFITNRDTEKQKHIDKINADKVETAKQEAVKYVDAAKKTDAIAGWPVSKEVKNSVLESFVEVDSVGKSEFVREVIENPDNAFKAMWYLKNGETYFNQLDKYYQARLQKVYEKGIQDGSEGKKPAAPGRKSGIKPKQNENPSPDDIDTVEDFINS